MDVSRIPGPLLPMRSMDTFERTTRALGTPLWTVALETACGPPVQIARWRHREARVSIPEAASVRVVLNLAQSPLVRHTECKQAIEVQTLPGSISVLSAHVSF